MRFPGLCGQSESLAQQRVSGVPSVHPMRYDPNMCSTASRDPLQALTAVRTLLSDTLHDVDDLTHDQASELLAQLRAVTGQADALTLAVVGKVDADGTYALDGHLSPRSWVQALAHQTPGEAARTVRTARALRSGVLPNTAAALAAGAITGRHAAVIADGVKGAPAGAVALIEPEAVATAADGRRAGHRERDGRLPARPGPRPGRPESTPPLRTGRDHVLPAAGRRVRPHRHRRRDHRRRHHRRPRPRRAAGHRRPAHPGPAPPGRPAAHQPVLARQPARRPPRTSPPAAPARPAPAWSSPSTSTGSPEAPHPAAP